MDTEQGWVIAIPDATAEDFGCRFYNGGGGFSKSALTSVWFTDRVKAEQTLQDLLTLDGVKDAYIKETRRIVPPRMVEGSLKRIKQSEYGLEEATDIYVIEVIPKNNEKLFVARIVVSDSPEDRVPDGNPFDPKLQVNRAIAMGEGDTLEEALDLMLRCLRMLKGHPGNGGGE